MTSSPIHATRRRNKYAVDQKSPLSYILNINIMSLIKQMQLTYRAILHLSSCIGYIK